MAMLTFGTLQILLGAALVLLGRWGRENADTLSPLYLDQGEREVRTAVIRRGSTASVIGGSLIVLTTVLVLVVNLAR